MRTQHHGWTAAPHSRISQLSRRRFNSEPDIGSAHFPVQSTPLADRVTLTRRSVKGRLQRGGGSHCSPTPASAQVAAYRAVKLKPLAANRNYVALIGVQRAHIELYIRDLGESGLQVSSVNTMMPGVRGFFRFAHIDGLIPANPAVYARLPKIHTDESRTQGLDRLELIRFLQVAQTLTVHHGALAYLLGINALRASEASAVRIEDYQETLRGHRVLHLVGKGAKPATMPLTVPVIRVLEACRGQRTEGPLVLRPVSGKPIDRRDVYRMVRRIATAAGIPSPHQSTFAAARSDHQRPRRRSAAARRPDPC